jgi:integrase
VGGVARDFDSRGEALPSRGSEYRRFSFSRPAPHHGVNAGRPGCLAPEIADVLGHETLAMVKRYSHLVVDHKAKVIEKMFAAKGL